jgi:hypothetical protein
MRSRRARRIVVPTRAGLAIAALNACFGGQTATPSSAPNRTEVRDSGVIQDGNTISGRVLLDGKPVRVFGVTLTVDAGSARVYEPQRVVRSKDGRFNVSLSAQGPRDVVIVGRGFARHIISRSEIELRGNLDLGTVVVSRGNTIQGTVRDERGAPVADARVALISVLNQLSEEPKDELFQFSIGNMFAMTDQGGEYVLEGVAPVVGRGSGHPAIRAWSSDRASVPVKAPDGDATVDLKLAPVGTIEAIANGPAEGLVSEGLVSALPVGGRPSDIFLPRSRLTGAGTIVFERVPAGDYIVFLYSRDTKTSSQHRVTVTAGLTASVTLTSPKPRVMIKVKADKPCSVVALKWPVGNSVITTSKCIGKEAEFWAIKPETYVACSTPKVQAPETCTSITVADTPVTQQFSIMRAP